MKDEIVVVDFGGQYAHLIARRVRDLGVFSSVVPCNIDPEQLADVRGIILSGGPANVTAEDAPKFKPEILRTGRPTLGICYGFQLLAHVFNGRVESGKNREYGPTTVRVEKKLPLFAGLEDRLDVWMSHGDLVKEVPIGFVRSAVTENGIVAAMQSVGRNLFGTQFHPEVTHTPKGSEILRNFIYGICRCQKSYSLEDQLVKSMDYIGDTVKGRDVIMFVSGGVDSTVAATLLARAKKAHRNVGNDYVGNVYVVHIDNGLMRLNESAQVVDYLKRLMPGQDIIFEDASAETLKKLEGIVDPERKRKIIGDAFVEVQDRVIERFGLKPDTVLCQGTLYTDRIESNQGVGDKASVIKTHHNVGSPYIMEKREKGLVVEPNREWYKDEVRKVGELLGLPSEFVWRQPFPGPGLGIRLVGVPVTRENLDVLRKAEDIYGQEIERAGLSRKIQQYFAVLLGAKSVGVMGDERTHQYVCALRAVNTDDFMTADWFDMPHDLLRRISGRIVNEVKGINRVLYDVTTKPPGTIEFE